MAKKKFAKKKKKLTRKQLILIVVLVLLFAVISIVGFTVLHYTGLINHIKDYDVISPEDEYFETDDTNGLEVIDPNSIEWDLSGPLGDEDLLNLLLVGQDRRPGQGRQRSDAMILISLNPDTGKVAVVSFMRDLYVQIPGYSDNRLNAAYVFGGFPLLKDTLYKNFGVTVDGCFEVDFSGFEGVINALGGVDLELSKAEAEIVGVSSGNVHLNGAQALTYARIRKIDSDFGRTQRQRAVLTSAFSKVRSKSVQELFSLLDKVLPLISTDMSTTQIYSLAAKLAPLAAKAEIANHTVPLSGTYRNANVRGMAVLIPDLPAIKKALRGDILPF